MLQEIKINLSYAQLNLSIRRGNFYARDLVSEQTFLHPDEYAKRLLLLKKTD